MPGTCNVCGGETVRGTDYTAPDELGQMVRLPSVTCLACTAIRPDAEEIARMEPRKIPSSVRIRCAQPAPVKPIVKRQAG